MNNKSFIQKQIEYYLKTDYDFYIKSIEREIEESNKSIRESREVMF